MKIEIDGRKLEVSENTTVLQAALSHGIYIPHLCHHKDLLPSGVCRLCLVKIEGRGIVTSCTACICNF